MKKKILFLTGTRADFGKLKSLIQICEKNENFEVHIFATGMHLHKQYGLTVNEIVKSGFKNIYKYINYTNESTMDLTLAKTIEGLSSYVNEEKPDLIVIHGDRVEALAGAIVGALNNILVAHIEGGEVSGTIDELIRHSVSKLSHVHFVSNEKAKKRLMQMGEIEKNIYEIGSPDVDIMFSNQLPSIKIVLQHYEIPFDKYAILMFHPVTTENEIAYRASNELVQAAIESDLNYVVIYPNNDLGSGEILKSYKLFEGNPKFKIFPSIRFEYFLVLLKNSQFIIGNSSAGIREAPYYGIPTINIGSRQMNRAMNKEIVNVDYDRDEIKQAISSVMKKGTYPAQNLFGIGESDKLFLEVLLKDDFWQINKQKSFRDIV